MHAGVPWLNQFSVCLPDDNSLEGAAFTEVVFALGHHGVTLALRPQLPADQQHK